MLLEGKVVAITGTGSGVGRAAAVLFAAHGASVLGGELRDDWNAATAELTKGTFVPVSCDVTKEDDIVALIEKARSQFGRLDVMFNNVGIASSKPGLKIDETATDEYQLLMDVNVRGVFWGCKHAVAAFKEQGAGGVIVNTGSAAGLVGWGRVAYGASKAAVIGMTRTLAVEVASLGIRVNCVCPGTIMTNFGRSEDKAFVPRTAEELDGLKARHPLGTVLTPEEVADAALFLACDLSTNVTGAALPVDGGYTAA
jgi:NAD(P)-dependent dehydrogenase (short-subunit alcohol dehydrogenase family)